MSNIIKAVMRRAKEHSYQNSGRNIENSRDLLLTWPIELLRLSVVRLT